MKLDHIAISAESIEETILFYSRYFERVEIKRFESDAYNIIIGNCCFGKLELFTLSSRKKIDIESKSLFEELHYVGLKHFAIATDNIEFNRLYEKFFNDNISFFHPKTKGKLVNTYFFIKDPNGVSIEILIP